MNLTTSDETEAMREVVRDLVAGWTRAPRSPDGQWAAIAELGLDLALVPESEEGLGLSLADLVPVLSALGPVAADWPWAAAIACGQPLARAAGIDTDLVTGVAVGDRARLVREADVVVVIDPEGTTTTPGGAWMPEPSANLVEQRPWSYLAPGSATPVDLPEARVVRASGRVAEASIQLGAGHAALERAAAHAKVRRQFGAAVGSFQAVKHLLADARTALSFAGPLVLAAAIAVDGRAPTFERDAAIALLAASDAARGAIRTAVQVHGAIGYTDELPLGELLAAVTDGLEAWGGEAMLADEIDRALRETHQPIGMTSP